MLRKKLTFIISHALNSKYAACFFGRVHQCKKEPPFSSLVQLRLKSLPSCPLAHPTPYIRRRVTTGVTLVRPRSHLDKFWGTIAIIISIGGGGQFGCEILKMMGPKKQYFSPRINLLKGFFFKQSCYELWSKNAEIVLSKSISYVKNWRIFFKKKIHLRISI